MIARYIYTRRECPHRCTSVSEKKQNLQELNSLAAGPGQPVESEAAGNGRAGGKFRMMVRRR